MGAITRALVLLLFVFATFVATASAADAKAKAPAPAKKPKPPKPPKKVKSRCPKKLFPFCNKLEFVCPKNCPQSCFINCFTCTPVCVCNTPGAVCQDPRFVGGDGITFYFHGRKDRDFCLVSDKNLHINAHFIGKRNPSMTRDFTWVQSIAVLFGRSRLFIAAKKTAAWDDAVDRLEISFNDQPVALASQEGATWTSSSSGLQIVRSKETNSVVLEVEGLFRISADVVPITEEESRVHNYGINGDDCFAHLELGFRFYSLTEKVDGVLGQTYRNGYVSPVKVTAQMPVMGGADKYATTSLYSTDCTVSRFGGVGSENAAAIATM